MKLHGNAALTPKQRLRLARRVVEEGWSLTERKWVRRYLGEGEAGLADRPSVPNSQPRPRPRTGSRGSPHCVGCVLTGAEIAEALGMALSTVQGILTRIGLGKLSRLEPPDPANRYERGRPGELLHIDVKKLGRIAGAGHRVAGNRKSQRRRRARRRAGELGWEFVHICATTPRAWPTSRCSRTRRPRPRRASCVARSRSIAPTGSGWRA